MPDQDDVAAQQAASTAKVVEQQDKADAWVAAGKGTPEPVETPAPEPVETPREPLTAADVVPAEPQPVPEPAQPTIEEVTAHITPVDKEKVGEAEGGEEEVKETASPTPTDDTKYVIFKTEDGQEYKVPEAAAVELKVGGELRPKGLKDVLSEGMMHEDYTRKTQETGRVRERNAEEMRELRAEAARIEARNKVLTDREAKLSEVMKDPDSAAAFAEHQQLLATNPEYRSTFERANRGDIAAAEAAADKESARRASQDATIDSVMQWSRELSETYPEVDVDRALSAYSTALQNQGARVERAAFEAVFKKEQSYIEGVRGPVNKDVEELRAMVAKLQEKADQTEHNDTTKAAITRQATVTTDPKGSRRGGEGTPKPKPHTIDQHQRVVEAWVDAGK